MSKAPKENKERESDLDEVNEEIDYDTQDIVIYDIDKIDKVYKELIESTEKLQEILKKPSISGHPLEVINERSIFFFF